MMYQAHVASKANCCHCNGSKYHLGFAAAIITMAVYVIWVLQQLTKYFLAVAYF
jgi:hypothetical protein